VTNVRRHEGAVIHREGRAPLLGLAGLLLMWVLWATGRAGGRVPRSVAFLSLTAFGFLAQFFRHPGCETPLDPGIVVSPAYGRVVHIGVEDEPEILNERRIRVSIFLSLFDPHLTRAPIAGHVTYERYHPGRYLVALHPKASELNERNSTLIEHASGTPVLVRQIAGLLARRICSYAHPGATVSAGEEIGFIKLGSRVDVFLPESASVAVSVGQYVRAGQTEMGRLAISVE
jgi:phosphatidylserine decarboxylase